MEHIVDIVRARRICNEWNISPAKEHIVKPPIRNECIITAIFSDIDICFQQNLPARGVYFYTMFDF